jgi:EmrB/QacA subfamily drug resistance transporter
VRPAARRDARLAGVTVTDVPLDPRVYARRWWTLSVLCLSLLLIVAGNSSLNVALPSIQRALGSSQSQLQWMVDIYSLVFAGLLLPAGALADRFGRKWALQGGLVLFLVASLAASVSTETWQLLVWRAVTGVGAAFIMPGTLSVLNNVFREGREKQRAIGIWAGCAGLGGALGPVLSGVLLRDFAWGSVFLINVVICVVAIGAGLVLVPNSSDPHEAELDPLGALLAVVGLATVLYGIIEAPDNGWGSTITIAAIGFGAAVLVGFGAWELRSRHPMLDIRLFRVREFNVGSLTITLQYFAAYGFFFVSLQYFQIAHGYSPLTAALLALPVGVFSMVGAPLSARFVERHGPRTVVGTGLLISAAGFLLLGWVTPTTAAILLLVAAALIGMGLGQTTAPSTTLIMTSVPRAKSGVGSAINDLSRELGGALGIAVLGSVVSTAYQHQIAPKIAAVGALPKGAGTSVFTTLDAAGKLHGPAGAALAGAATDAFSSAFGIAMIAGAAVLVLNSILVWVRQVRPEAATTAATAAA